jgi:alpha-1,6-mannosyltransferase
VNREPGERWVPAHRYVLLAGAVVLMAVGYKLKLRWPGGVDIWEHAAAARELGAHPLDPGHPLLPVHRPHQFFSPYLMVVGLLGRLAGVSVITALDVASVFNLVLVLVGLRLFVRRVTTAPHADFWALLFVLFLWGPGAWFFSGFLHFDVVFVVLSYPSTFAKGVVFLALLAHLNYLERDDARWLAPFLLASAVVLLTHPVDALFLALAAASFSVTHPGGDNVRHLVTTALTVAASFFVALLWPPLPLFDLLFGREAEAYRASIAVADRDMYAHVLTRLGLALLVVPFAARRLWRWRREPLALILAGTLLGYGYGWVTGEWSYGRLISSAQLVGAIILADERAKAGRPGRRGLQLATAAVVLTGVFLLRNGFSALPDRIVAGAPYRWVHSYVDEVRISDFDFLAQNHRTYTIVLSDLYTSLEVPAFGSKTVAFARTQAFVDTSERASDVNTFYGRGATAEFRQAIISKYGVSLLIVPVDHLTDDPALYGPLLDLGRVVWRNDRFVFVDVRPR